MPRKKKDAASESSTAAKAPKKATKKATKKAAPKADTGLSGWVNKLASDKKFQGVAQICMANEVATPYHLRRPTGILSLDLAMGGGLHAGGGIEIHGEESVGKTYLAYRVCGEVQRIYGDDAAILIFSTEIRPDKGFARKAGFHIGYSEKEIEEYQHIRSLRGMEPFTPEEVADLRSQTGTVVYLGAATADVGLDVVVEALKDGRFQLVLIESMGAFLTREVEEDSTGQKHYGGSSVIVTNFQNKVYPLFMMDRPDGSMLETTVIGINQARATMDAGKYAPKTRQASGAYAWKHGQMLSVELGKGQRIKAGEGEPDIGREVRWKLTKGKAGTHDGKKGTYSFFHMRKYDPVFWADVLEKFMGGADINADIVGVAEDLGVVAKNGAWYSWEAHGIKGQGLENFAIALEEAGLLEELRDTCLRTSDLMVRYR